jgi:hypothetical protein
VSAGTRVPQARPGLLVHRVCLVRWERLATPARLGLLDRLDLLGLLGLRVFRA